MCNIKKEITKGKPKFVYKVVFEVDGVYYSPFTGTRFPKLNDKPVRFFNKYNREIYGSDIMTNNMLFSSFKSISAAKIMFKHSCKTDWTQTARVSRQLNSHKLVILKIYLSNKSRVFKGDSGRIMDDMSANYVTYGFDLWYKVEIINERII